MISLGAHTRRGFDALLLGFCFAACSEPPSTPPLVNTGGTCGVSGQTACGTSCVNLQSDPANCGACGQSCGPGGVCSAGVCSCQAGMTLCNGACVDTLSNGAHCGGCGVTCTGQVCASGVCQSSCPQGTLTCGSSCVNSASDPLNCGGCAVVCAAEQVCQGGCICQPDLTACSGACVDMQSNGLNCGACGNVCALGQVCSTGVCQGSASVTSSTVSSATATSASVSASATNSSNGSTSDTTGTSSVSTSATTGDAATTSTGVGGATSTTTATVSSTASGAGGATATTSTPTTATATATTGGASTCPGASASEVSLVASWLNNTSATGALPQYAYNNIQSNFPAGAARDELVCAIAASCAAFAPGETNWLRKCEAVITSAIVAESSYNPASVVDDSYSTRNVNGTTADDPTVGLLQIRFSSTVHDYNYYAPLEKMATIGCAWPSALTSQADTATWWATQGGTTYLSFMQGVSCNVALATWYYFYNATGNGGQSAVWISNYCSGQGVAGNMVVGLLSHLMGGAYPRPADTNNAYPWGIECCAGGNPSITACTGCTGRFAAFMGIGTSSSRPNPDPFLETLAPQPSKYCR